MHSATILSVASCALVSFVDLVFELSLLSSSYRIYSSASDSSAALSASFSVILSAKIFRSASAIVYPSVSAISVRNGRRRTALMTAQYPIFFDFSSLPAAAQRRTYVVRRRIFLPPTVKARLILINTTLGASRDPAREKAVTVFQGKFSKRTCARTLPGSTQVWRSWRVSPGYKSLCLCT